MFIGLVQKSEKREAGTTTTYGLSGVVVQGRLATDNGNLSSGDTVTFETSFSLNYIACDRYNLRTIPRNGLISHGLISRGPGL